MLTVTVERKDGMLVLTSPKGRRVAIYPAVVADMADKLQGETAKLDRQEWAVIRQNGFTL